MVQGSEAGEGDDRVGWVVGWVDGRQVGWHHQLDRYELSKLWEMVKDREAWCAAVPGVTELNLT